MKTPLPAESLQQRILRAVTRREHRAILFTRLDDVPGGSAGYFSPSGESATRMADGRWVVQGTTYETEKLGPREISFTVHSGPANDAKLAELLLEEFVPEHHILVDFKAVTDHESGDWELSQPGYDYTVLADPEILGHRLDDAELARLYFEIEANGNLGERDGYDDLDKKIQEISEAPAMAVRDKAAANRHEGLQLGADL